MKNKKIIKVGIIGAGYMAFEHLKVFSKLKNVKLDAIYSRTYNKSLKLKKKFLINTIYRSLEDFCQNINIDLLVISVTEDAVLKICKETFKYKFVHLIEKPIGLNFYESKILYTLSQKYKTKVYASLNRRFYSSTIEVINQLKNDKSKRIINIIDQEDTVKAAKLGIGKKIIKNWMYANSIHLIDYILTLGRGKIVKINKILHKDNKNKKYKIVQITFDSNDVVNYQAFWNYNAPWSVSVSTAKKFFLLQPIEELHIRNEGKYKFAKITPSKYDQLYKPGIYLQNSTLIDNMLNNRAISLPSIKTSNKLMKLIKDIYF